MSIITEKQLKTLTNDFLNKHYCDEHLPSPKPEWKRWELEGPRPYNENPGCYAMIFETDGEENIEYIGIGIGESGIGSRINTYHRVDYRNGDITVYKPIERLIGLKALLIIGFDPKLNYILPALELFLISRLEPNRNSRGTSKTFKNEQLVLEP